MTRNGLLLALFGLAAAGLVALTHEGTKDRIAEQQKQQLVATLAQILPGDLYNNAPHDDCRLLQSRQYLGTREPQPAFIARRDSEPVAMAMETVAPDGYNGDIHLIVGIRWNGEILGVRTLNHNETPGLGDLIDIRRSDWVTRFSGYQLESEKDPRFAVKRDGGEFDQFTGATITPRAYVKAVKNALIYFNSNKAKLLQAPRCWSENEQGAQP
ncbi:electron transport complex subunit RsxG [Ferrimonas gelatinilytica]